MNIYDFDKTIFTPDSSFLFIVTCLKKYPSLILKILPGVVSKSIARLVGRADTAELKEALFSFLAYLSEPDKEVSAYWEENYWRLETWYTERKQETDIIISASPEFLLSPACKHIGVQLIGTRMDIKTGKINGKNCKGEEKVKRLRELYPNAHIDEFFSDSLSDTPLARLADKAFLVDHGKLTPWPEQTKAESLSLIR